MSEFISMKGGTSGMAVRHTPQRIHGLGIVLRSDSIIEKVNSQLLERRKVPYGQIEVRTEDVTHSETEAKALNHWHSSWLEGRVHQYKFAEKAHSCTGESTVAKHKLLKCVRAEICQEGDITENRQLPKDLDIL